MKTHTHFYLSFLLSFTLAAAPTNVWSSEGLIEHMGALQYFSHKTGLAIDNKNAKLAYFYAHETEETLEEVVKIKSFDGYPVGTMAKKILEPAFEELEDAIKAKNWSAASTRFDEMIDACNHCHKDTDHGYVKIARNKDNPYMQSFKP